VTIHTVGVTGGAPYFPATTATQSARSKASAAENVQGARPCVQKRGVAGGQSVCV